MKSIATALLSAVLLFVLPWNASAVPHRTHVADFTVVGAPNRDELKTSLQSILASRLNPEQVQLVESRDKAELLVTGSYALFGKVFSLDVLIKQMGSGKLTKVFEQGEGQDDLIPAMGRLARKIEQELTKMPPEPAVAAAAPPPPLPNQPKPALPAPSPAAAPSGNYVVKSAGAAGTPGNWSSTPLDGVFAGIALGRNRAGSGRELFVAGERTIRYFRQGTELKQVAEVVLPRPAKILGIDTADLDSDGIPEIYVTVMDRETLISQVYLPTEAGLEKIADNLPYFFRGIGPDLGTRKILVQELDAGGDYYNGVAELSKTGKRFEARNRQQLPRTTSIFPFNRFNDDSGKSCQVMLDGNGHLIVSSQEGRELWKSSDRFGGSEMFFTRESMTQMRATGGDPYVWTFLEQRIIATPDGKLLVPHNEGIMTVGNNRSYSKHTLHAFTWSGAVLKELWHSKQEPTYLADFAYDPATAEVVVLEVVQKDGIFSKGKSVVSIHKVE